MIRALAFAACLTPLSAKADVREVAQVRVMNEEAVLFDDGTWAFVNPEVSMTEAGAVPCLISTDDRIRFCPDPNLWINRTVLAYQDYEEHAMQSANGAFTLSASREISYGHGGDTADYAEMATVTDSLLMRLFFGVDNNRQDIVIADDVVVILGRFDDPGSNYYTRSVEILLPDQSFYFDMLTVPFLVTSDGAVEPNETPELGQVANELMTALADQITIDDDPMTQLLEANRK